MLFGVKPLVGENGSLCLHDPKADPYADSCETLADDSDTSIMDLVRDNGFEIYDDNDAVREGWPIPLAR